MARKLFCELHPAFYHASVAKERGKRHVQNLRRRTLLATERREAPLPNLVKGHTSLILRKLHNVDMRLQENKKVNLALAVARINGLVIHPGETFSFWYLVGKPSRRRGYKDGLVIASDAFRADAGGGLCQLANMIHYLVLNSPLEVTELHHHSDALFPDDRRRVPFGTGTSVFYNYVDYRFRNNSDQDVQLLVWIQDDMLYGELRSEVPFPHRYKLSEENHHFRKEGGSYYRISQVYKIAVNRQTRKEMQRWLILDNHSRVMYDPSLIPPEEIRP
ncbi:MAG: VanW family protein [Peptococcaceae bacterium]|nr:VanW family protein [Peptococcaceae bacterium]